MRAQTVRWGVSQIDLEYLSKTIRPVRSSREVAVILGLSTSLVCQIENSALRKIVRAMKRLEAKGQLRPQKNNSNHE
jgi:hypothetical protein